MTKSPKPRERKWLIETIWPSNSDWVRDLFCRPSGDQFEPQFTVLEIQGEKNEKNQ
ncbi:hypothetical protein HYPP_03786 [Hyphomicrobium sp. ghe19]|nr:hypothetical protein HYPP_03786 [Hyphomicrobium sp. ghe19]